MLKGSIFTYSLASDAHNYLCLRFWRKKYLCKFCKKKLFEQCTIISREARMGRITKERKGSDYLFEILRNINDSLTVMTHRDFGENIHKKWKHRQINTYTLTTVTFAHVFGHRKDLKNNPKFGTQFFLGYRIYLYMCWFLNIAVAFQLKMWYPFPHTSDSINIICNIPALC